MFTLERISFNPHSKYFANTKYIPQVQKYFRKYFKYIQDDFSNYDTQNISDFIKQTNPYFWIVLDSDRNFLAFIFLDNFIGNENKLYSAELTTCAVPEIWGSFTRFCAKVFLKKCFDELGLYKIKAQIYPDNFRVKTLLKNSGFVYESTLKNETIRFGKMQDIEVYGLYRNYYYKQ